MENKNLKQAGNINWQAPEHFHYEKTSDWYWTLGIIIIGIVIGSIMLGNLLFGILALVSGFALMLHGSKKPDITNFSIDNKGVTIGKKIYTYENLQSFWVNQERHELIIKSKKTFMPLISIIISDNVNPDIVKQHLLNHIKEEKMEEPFITTISRILKF